jgi:hypothetical protein
MKPGDKVFFHMVPMHLCGGGKALSKEVADKRVELGLSEQPPSWCQCSAEASIILDAVVVTVHELEKDLPQALELDVAMTDAELALGYVSRQSYSYQALTDPPESGTWTE